MNILVIGSGGREHAIIRKIAQSPRVETVYALPGNAGIASTPGCECVPISATDLPAILGFAASPSHKIDFAVVTPDDPLCMGLVDELERIGIPAFGPSKAAARIEGSKSFAKRLMSKYNIPTARFAEFDNYDDAVAYLKRNSPPYVIKADGLALGKGVEIAATLPQAVNAVRERMVDMRFGESGKRVVIEECLSGPEASLLLFTDGDAYRLMPTAMDHKRAFDNDEGDNTGGMGCVAPNLLVTPAMLSEIESRIVIPTLAAMRAEGHPFRGCLFIGLMLTNDGPKVIEYNARFGDPETQAVMPLLESDLLDILIATTNHTLDRADARFSRACSCCVVIASGGYPGKYETGKPITLPAAVPSNARLDFAGVSIDSIDNHGNHGRLVTSGGRVVGVTATANTMEGAISGAYALARQICFEGMRMRSDIGAKILREL